MTWVFIIVAIVTLLAVKVIRDAQKDDAARKKAASRRRPE
jgi:large-conductance mechanosensitive channel